VIIISACSGTVYHFYEVNLVALKLQTMKFFVQTLENAIF